MRLDIRGMNELKFQILKYACEDYFDCVMGFNKATHNRSGHFKVSRRELDRFFKSAWFDRLSDYSAEYLKRKILDRAKTLEVTHRVWLQDGQYYVRPVSDSESVGEEFRTKKEALYRAAQLSDMAFTTYRRMIERDGGLLVKHSES